MPNEVRDGARRVRAWCITVNSGERFSIRDIVAKLGEFARGCDQVRFFIGQCEKCPSTGREHFQAYLQLHNPNTLQACKRKLRVYDERFNTVHLEPANGSADDNIAYCTKEDSRHVPEGFSPEEASIRHGEVHHGAGRGAGKKI